MTTNNVLAQKLLPIIFAASSLTAVACAAPTTTSTTSNETSSEESKTTNDTAEMTASEAVAKIPSSAMIGEQGPSDVAMPGETKELAPLQLYIPQLKLTYPVAGFAFSVSNPSSIGSATAGATTGKATFSSLTVHVQPTMGTASLAVHLAQGTLLDKMILVRPAQGKSKPVEIATFGTVAIAQMFTTGQNQGLNEAYEFKFGSLELKTPQNEIASLDVTKNLGEISTPSSCAYGPFVQAYPTWPVPAPGVAIDRFSLLMSNDASIGSAQGGAGAGKAHLDSLAIDSKFDKTGVCALHDLLTAANLGSMKFAVATAYDQAKNKLAIPYKWESCMTYVTGLTFYGGGTDEIHQTIDFAAGGIIRTDATQQKTGDFVDGAPTGWSFINNTSIKSCSDVTIPF
jgi:hypothetical protein